MSPSDRISTQQRDSKYLLIHLEPYTLPLLKDIPELSMSSGGAQRDSTSLLPETVSLGDDRVSSVQLSEALGCCFDVDGTIIIWHQVESRAEIATFGEDEEEEKAHEKEFWKEKRMIV
jgi:hypothetical protein